MKELFDFGALKAFLATGFSLRMDCMHGGESGPDLLLMSARLTIEPLRCRWGSLLCRVLRAVGHA